MLRRVVILAVTGVSLYLVGPAVLDVLASWPKVRDLDPLLLQTGGILSNSPRGGR